MDLEKAGHVRERFPLKQQARFALRCRYTDGVIDGMLASENVRYDMSSISLLSREGSDRCLKVIFPQAHDNAKLIADWIAEVLPT